MEIGLFKQNVIMLLFKYKRMVFYVHIANISKMTIICEAAFFKIISEESRPIIFFLL
jgi:hypothetical protein